MLRFADPWFAVPVAVLLVGYLVAWVRIDVARRRDAVRFSDPELLALLLPVRPGWRRHVAPAAIAAALAVSTVAAANPQIMTETDRPVTQVVLAIDVSPSMLADDVEPTRLAAAQRAARQFVRSAPDGIEIGLVTFAGSAQPVTSPTANKLALLGMIERLDVPSGGTATGDGLQAALGTLSLAEPELEDDPTGTIVLLADGGTNMGSDPLEAAEDAAERGVVIHTVGVGTPNATFRGEPMLFDEQELMAIAELTGGETFTADDADSLTVIFDRLGSAIEDIFVFSSISHLLAILAAVLFAAGGLVGLVRAQRVV
jgi:Ca-activated chloride channel homolog